MGLIGQRPAAALRRRHLRPDVAGRLPAAAAALAGGDLRATGRRRSGGPNFAYELCVRQDRARGARGARPLAAGRWPSTAPSRSAPRRSSASPRRSRPAASGARRSTPATGWPRRRCSSPARRRASAPAVRAVDAAALERHRAEPRAARRRRRARLVGCGRLAGSTSGSRSSTRRPRGPSPDGRGRRDLGRRPERRRRLLEPAGGDGADLRARGWRDEPGGAVPAHRRPRLPRTTASCSSPAGSRT